MMRCPFCRRVMDLLSGGGLSIDHYACEVCGCEWTYGLHELPDPDRLREEAGVLEEIADELEEPSELVIRLQEALS